MSTIISQLLEHKYEAERMFAGCAFIQPEDCIRDCGWLKPEQFTLSTMGEFWRKLLAGDEPQKAAIDAKCYSELLGIQTKIVTTVYYQSLAETIQMDEYYISIAENSAKLADAAGSRDKDSVQDLIGKLSTGMITNTLKTYDSVDVAMQTADLISHGNMTVKTNMRVVDQALGGFARKTLTLIAGRPSMGKTTLAATIARSAAQAFSKVLFISLEENKESMWAKWVCGACGLSYVKLISGELDERQMDLFSKTSSRLMEKYENRLIFIDDPRLDSAAIYSIVCRVRPDIFIVDHTELVKDKIGKGETDAKRVGNISLAGREIAKIFDCAAIYLQQLNRGVEGRADKRPTMADLRSSGELEQNADNVLLLYRDDYYNQAGVIPDVSYVEMIVGKFRSGIRNSLISLEYVPREYWYYSKGERKK